MKTHQLDESNRIIQGLWIGSKLSLLEQLSIVSFLRNGHDYHLYAYSELANVPAGTVVKDANEILPASSIFQYKDRPSYAGFANYFRYKLLLERGGWWVDTDVVCLRPFDFEDELVFASELSNGRQLTANCVIKAPPNTESMSYAWNVCQRKDPRTLVWGETGPRLMSEVVKRFRLKRYEKPTYTFCPIVYTDWHKLLVPYLVGINENAYAIHFWNDMWALANQDKDADYQRGCIYEQLKVRYGYA